MNTYRGHPGRRGCARSVLHPGCRGPLMLHPEHVCSNSWLRRVRRYLHVRPLARGWNRLVPMRCFFRLHVFSIKKVILSKAIRRLPFPNPYIRPGKRIAVLMRLSTFVPSAQIWTKRKRSVSSRRDYILSICEQLSSLPGGHRVDEDCVMEGCAIVSKNSTTTAFAQPTYPASGRYRSTL